jgi:hypothetical protein
LEVFDCALLEDVAGEEEEEGECYNWGESWMLVWWEERC